jgi:hypothetical protein
VLIAGRHGTRAFTYCRTDFSTDKFTYKADDSCRQQPPLSPTVDVNAAIDRW